MADTSDPDGAGSALRAQLAAAERRIADLEIVEAEHFRVVEDLHLHQEELRAQNQELREAQQALAEAGRRYQDLFDFAPVAYFLLDQNGAIEEANFTACRLLGEDRSSLVQRPMRLYVDSEARSSFDLFLINAATSRRTATMDTSLCGRAQECVPVQLTLAVDRVQGHLRYRLAALDVSERMKTEEQRRLAATMFEESNEGVLITDALGRIQRVNRAFTVVTGYTEREVVGKTPAVLSSGRHDAAFYREMWERLINVGGWMGEIWNRRKNGEVYPEWLKINTVRGADGEIRHFVGIFSDIGDHKRTGQDVERYAFYDTLTDLPNRTLFVERLKHALVRAHRDARRVVLLYLDLDRFKIINDTLGHQTGDLLLQQVATRLRQLVRAHDTVARLGGDEFTVALSDMEDDATALETARRVAEKIHEHLSRPFFIAGREVVSGSSIGIALHPRDGETYGDLVKHADIAMYHAKHGGGGGYAFFSSEMNAQVVRRVSLETALRGALRREELELAFQPVVHADDRRVVGVEALLRWSGPDGPVSPLEFMPILEMLGQGPEVARWALARAGREVAGWDFAGAGGLWLSVNLSPRQLHQLRLAWIVEAIEHAHIEPGRLVLEVTEEHFHPNADMLIRQLEDVRGIGARVALDDFGIGHSSLGRLRHLPIDIIKLDRAFVRGLPDDAKDVAIVSTVMTMARHLNLDFLAEGVENDGQLHALRAHGCTLFQGFVYTPPLPGPECARWCANFGAAT